MRQCLGSTRETVSTETYQDILSGRSLDLFRRYCVLVPPLQMRRKGLMWKGSFDASEL